MARPNTVHARLTDDGLKVVDDIAKQEQRTRSDMVRVLIAEAVKARGKR